MTGQSPYQDKRADFWREHFERALPFAAYLAQEADHAAKWREMQSALPGLTTGELRQLGGKNRALRVLVLCGAWCGDCARQVPMLEQIAGAVGEQCDLRLVDRDAHPDLREELRLLGAMRVPVAVFLSEDFYEVGRFGDRLLFAYRRKAERELGEACDAGILSPPTEELIAERVEWVDVFERMLLMLRLAPPLRSRWGD